MRPIELTFALPGYDVDEVSEQDGVVEIEAHSLSYASCAGAGWTNWVRAQVVWVKATGISWQVRDTHYALWVPGEMGTKRVGLKKDVSLPGQGHAQTLDNRT